MNGIIFSIADQINYGINHGLDDPATMQSQLRINLVELNELAGTKAMDCSDYATARSYLSTAQSLLPTDQWKTQYSLSLSVSFLSAKCAYSCGDAQKAQTILQEIIGECQCMDDKLPAYFLLITSKLPSHLSRLTWVSCVSLIPSSCSICRLSHTLVMSKLSSSLD